jgi:lipoprotein-anchoring transpeptidase ErfK/SrfK
MRDFIAIVFVFALVVAGYFGYKHFFGEEAVVSEAQAQVQPMPANPAPAPEPAKPAEVQPETVQAVDPLKEAQKRVTMGKSNDMARDLFYLARDASSKGWTEKSLGYMKKIYSGHRDSPYAPAAAVALAGHEIAEGRKWEARNLLSFAYDRTSDEKTRKSYTAKMDELNATLVYSPAGSKDSVIYQVQPGDILSKLAAKYNCPYRLMMKINGIKDPRKLRVGQRLKILSGPDGSPMKMSIFIDKSEFRLTVYLNGHYLKEYAVGIGQHDFTPAGEFTVGERIKDPSYQGKPHGHPENILGDYWVTLESEKYPGLGMHGTTEPDSIGTKSSLGCIRMLNKDIGELYGLIPKGAKVTIRE